MSLPCSIVDEILLLLPVKSLARFKVACKDWYSHISSHRFIAKHIKNQSGNEKILIYQKFGKYITVSICSEQEKQDDDDDDDDTNIPTLFHESKQQQFFIACPVQPPIYFDTQFNEESNSCHIYSSCPINTEDNFGIYISEKNPVLESEIKSKNYRGEVSIVGTCNGIFCLAYKHGYDKIITLWNPTTRELNTLPRFEPLNQRPPGTHMVGDHIGFGFDCTTDDYKVVRILYCGKDRFCPSPKFIIKMRIYSLSTNSWRDFDDRTTTIISNDENHGVLFGNNKFCWLARNGSEYQGNESLILSFDMGKEEFQETPLPLEYVNFVDYVNERSRRVPGLFQMHDSIALVLYAQREKKFHIWTTKDLEQGLSTWIKLSSVGPISGIERPLGFWKCKNSNSFLFLFCQWVYVPKMKIDMKGIYMNNLDQIKTNRLMIIKVNNTFDLDIIPLPIQIFTYVETLVAVNRS